MGFVLGATGLVVLSLGPAGAQSGRPEPGVGVDHERMQQHREQMQKLCPLGAPQETPR